MKPPIRYFGAKGALAERTVSLMPPHAVYVEPYAGSLAVLLAKAPAPQQRGYDAEHHRRRAAWAPRVAGGTVRCASPHCLRPDDQIIHPAEPWDLGHTDDRTRTAALSTKRATAPKVAERHTAHRGPSYWSPAAANARAPD